MACAIATSESRLDQAVGFRLRTTLTSRCVVRHVAGDSQRDIAETLEPESRKATFHSNVPLISQADRVVGRDNVSVTLGRLNDEELRTIATIALRSNGFRNLTGDDVRTLAATTRMEEFRREDR